MAPVADPADREARTLRVTGRLKPGVAVATAAAEIRGLAERQERDHPVTNARWSAEVLPDSAGHVRSQRLDRPGPHGRGRRPRPRHRLRERGQPRARPRRGPGARDRRARGPGREPVAAGTPVPHRGHGSRPARRGPRGPAGQRGPRPHPQRYLRAVLPARDRGPPRDDLLRRDRAAHPPRLRTAPRALGHRPRPRERPEGLHRGQRQRRAADASAAAACSWWDSSRWPCRSCWWPGWPCARPSPSSSSTSASIPAIS